MGWSETVRKKEFPPQLGAPIPSGREVKATEEGEEQHRRSKSLQFSYCYAITIIPIFLLCSPLPSSSPRSHSQSPPDAHVHGSFAHVFD